MDAPMEECSDGEYWQASHHLSSEESNDEDSNEEVETERWREHSS